MLRKFPIFAPPKGPTLKTIKWIMELIGKAFGSKSSEVISKKEKLDETKVSDVIDYNELINDFTEEIKGDMENVESKLLDECTEYYGELITLVEGVEQIKNINLHSKFIKKDFEILKRNIKGNLMKSIYSKISLDNDDLKNILKLPSGEMKKTKIDNFKKDLIKQALNEFISEVRISIDDFQNYISEKLNEVLEGITNNYQILSKQLMILENSNDIEGIKNMIEESKVKLVLSNEILSTEGM